MSARWMTLLVWAAVAAATLFWSLRLMARPIAVPPQAQVAEAAAVPRGDLTRLFGADAPPPVQGAAPEPAADARFSLLGVVNPRAPQAAREGLALIAVDGKPPRAYRVGALVDGQHVLQGVSARGATLGPRDGPAVIALNLAPPPVAATGTLPPAATLPGAVMPPRPPPTVMPQPVPQPAPSGTPLPLPQQSLPPAQREQSLR